MTRLPRGLWRALDTTSPLIFRPLRLHRTEVLPLAFWALRWQDSKPCAEGCVRLKNIGFDNGLKSNLPSRKKTSARLFILIGFAVSRRRDVTFARFRRHKLQRVELPYVGPVLNGQV